MKKTLFILLVASCVASAEQGDVGYDPPAPGSDDTGYILIDNKRNKARENFDRRIRFAVDEYRRWSKEGGGAVEEHIREVLSKELKTKQPLPPPPQEKGGEA